MSMWRPSPLSAPGARRAVAFFALWLILSGADPAGLAAGVVATAAATFTSLRLLPAVGRRLSPSPTFVLLFHFLRQSIIAGADVAWRALAPRLPLRPGFTIYPLRLAPSAARNTFCILSSLLPGTLPVGWDERDALLIHCLDVNTPIATQLSEEEALLLRALGGGHDHR
jgi:multicomponent Na+:H+ antiporter subunit E